MQAITTRVRRLVAEKLGVPEAQLEPTAELATDLGADSLDVVELLMTIENHFQIRIPDEDFAELQTLGEVLHYVVERVAPAPAHAS